MVMMMAQLMFPSYKASTIIKFYIVKVSFCWNVFVERDYLVTPLPFLNQQLLKIIQVKLRMLFYANAHIEL